MRKSAYRLRDEIWDVYYKLNIRDAISFVDQVQAVVVSRRQDGPGRRGYPHVWPHVHPLARQRGPAHPSWVLAVLMPALFSHLSGWPRALSCQAGTALHAQPHVHVRVISHKPPVSTTIPPSSWTDLVGPHSCPIPWRLVAPGLAGGWHDVGTEPSLPISMSPQEGERERRVPGPAGDRHGAEPPGQGGRCHAPRAAREPLQAPPAGEHSRAMACG